jgi:hypothetical protein
MSTRRNGRTRQRSGRHRQAARAVVPVDSRGPAIPDSGPLLLLPSLPPRVLVQVVRLERQVRWQQRRELVTVALPRAVLGRRVADGLRAVPFRFGLLAFVGFVLLRDVGVRGAIPVTLWGVVVGVGIGLALVKGLAVRAVVSPAREGGGDDAE